MGVLREPDIDLRSLKELMTYGLKGMAAYLEHAMRLGYDDASIHTFMQHALAATATKSLPAGEWVKMVLQTGEYGVKTMALLDKANTERYGNPEMTKSKYRGREASGYPDKRPRPERYGRTIEANRRYRSRRVHT